MVEITDKNMMKQLGKAEIKKHKSQESWLEGLKDLMADQKERADQEKETAEKNEMAAEALGIGMEEFARRQKADKEISEREDKLDEMIAAQGGESIETEKEAQVIQKMRDKEDARRGLKTNDLLEDMTDKIGNMSSGLTDALSVTAKGIGIGVAFFALAAFLKSDMFQSILDFFVDFVFDLTQLFTGQKSFWEAFSNNITLFSLSFLWIGAKLFAIVKSIAIFKTALLGTLTSLTGSFAFLSPIFVSMKTALAGMLAPLLPIVAVMYAGARIIKSIQENFSKAHKEFGFFGGIVVSLWDTIRDIFVDVLEFLDIIGLIPNDFIEYMKNIDIFAAVRTIIDSVVDFFSGIKEGIDNFISDMIPDWAKKYLPRDASPEKIATRPKVDPWTGQLVNEPINNADALTSSTLAEAITSATDIGQGDKLTQLRIQQAELQKGKSGQTIVNNITTSQNNVAGDTIRQDRSTIYIKDRADNGFTSMA